MGGLLCGGTPNPTTVAHLLKYRSSQLLSFPGFGRGSLANLQSVLRVHGLRLPFEQWEIDLMLKSLPEPG